MLIDDLDYHVDMIGHDAQAEQSIAHAIEMHQGIFDHRGDVGTPEPARSQPNVQLAVEAGQRMIAMPKRFRHVGWQTVSQSESDELDRFRRVEVR